MKHQNVLISLCLDTNNKGIFMCVYQLYLFAISPFVALVVFEFLFIFLGLECLVWVYCLVPLVFGSVIGL